MGEVTQFNRRKATKNFLSGISFFGTTDAVDGSEGIQSILKTENKSGKENVLRNVNFGGFTSFESNESDQTLVSNAVDDHKGFTETRPSPLVTRNRSATVTEDFKKGYYYNSFNSLKKLSDIEKDSKSQENLDNSIFASSKLLF
ncbi:uncharacterized protein LOC136033766 [Artemia franciscana]|uniref:uncharacterized protein LOC136033766 n=1 Tax=Artemia franciscana TaxID=6661 RepID=UPI0032DB4448